MSTPRKMSEKEKLTEVVVGLFFFAALIILSVYTMILNREFFGAKQNPMRLQFPYIDTLQDGDRIFVHGVSVGRVKGVGLSPDSLSVVVDAILTQDVVLYQNYVMKIRNSSVVGGRYIHIDPGTPDAGILAPGATLTGAAPVDVVDEAAEFIRKIKTEMEDTDFLDKLADAVDNVRDVTAKMRNGEGTMGKMINDDALYTETKESVETLRRVSDKVESVLDSVKSAGDSAREAGESIETAADNLNEVVEKIRKGEGTVGKLVNDGALYDDAKKLVDDLREATENVSNDKSSLGKLLHDDGEFYTTLKDSFSNMEESFDISRDIAQKIKNGEGTLGKLVQDESLYDDAKVSVEQFRKAVDDFREQTPISTFGSFIFGAL